MKGILDKLFKSGQQQRDADPKSISQEDVEALIDAKFKEHATEIHKSGNNNGNEIQTEEDYTLTPKQVDYALSLISKLGDEYELAMDPAQLTIKDLNRLIAFNRYKNKGILVNLAKKGVLKKK